MSKTKTKIVSTGRTRTTVKGGNRPATLNINTKYDVGDNILALGILISGGMAINAVCKGVGYCAKRVVNKVKNNATPAPVPAPVPRPEEQA